MHATHQFFLRSKCLYVIVLAGRAGREHNPNEEAEYWLQHVRAFGDSAPVLLVGNKADVMPVNLDLRTLTGKYPNIAGFYPLSCTQAKCAFKAEFALFYKKFGAQLKALGEAAERFSPDEFTVLKAIESKAAKKDFLSQAGFNKLCAANGIAMEGPSGRDRLLDIFDKLGIVMHFAGLPFLTDYVLNPRWLTYGVYTIMYSNEAKAAKGRLSEASLVAILKKANPSIPAGRRLRYPPDRCGLIADAMIAFRIAYRLRTGELVIPALLPLEQPGHDFSPDGALSFRFDFGGFLPRNVLSSLIVEHFQDITNGREIVWQNGVLLRPRPGRHDAEALVRADYHARRLGFSVKGSDAPVYLGMLRESVRATLETMPQLPFEEKVELRPDMRVEAIGPAQTDDSDWIDYGIIQTAQRLGHATVVGREGVYDMRRVLAAMPVRPDGRGSTTLIFDMRYSNQPRGSLMGDIFSNISNATIINRSLLQNAFNKAKSETGEDTAEALRKVAEAVAQSGNKEAGELLDQFNEELAKTQPRKSLLKRSWENLVQVLPTIGAIAGAAEAIAKLFA